MQRRVGNYWHKKQYFQLVKHVIRRHVETRMNAGVCNFLVYVLPPVPRCSDWASSSLISSSRISLPR